MIFDDSYEHWVTHESELTRIVLFFDIWHPDWTKEEVELLDEAEKFMHEKYRDQSGSFINRMQEAYKSDFARFTQSPSSQLWFKS